jgi:hypothetical protein
MMMRVGVKEAVRRLEYPDMARPEGEIAALRLNCVNSACAIACLCPFELWAAVAWARNPGRLQGKLYQG